MIENVYHMSLGANIRVQPTRDGVEKPSVSKQKGVTNITPDLIADSLLSVPHECLPRPDGVTSSQILEQTACSF